MFHPFPIEGYISLPLKNPFFFSIFHGVKTAAPHPGPPGKGPAGEDGVLSGRAVLGGEEALLYSIKPYIKGAKLKIGINFDSSSDTKGIKYAEGELCDNSIK